MRLLLSHDKLITSDMTTTRAYALDGDTPALIASAEHSTLPAPHSLHEDGYPLRASAGALIARLRVSDAQEDWYDAQQLIELLDPQLHTVAVVVTDALINPESLAISPAADRVAANIFGEGVGVWDVASGARVVHVLGEISSGVSWSPDGRYLVAGDTDQGGGELYLIDLEADEEEQRQGLPDPTSRIPLYDAAYASAWAPDSAAVAVSCAAWGMRGVVVYDPTTQTERWSQEFETGDDDEDAELWEALDVAFAAGGALLLAGIEVGELRVWRAADGTPLAPLACEDATSSRFAVDDARRCVWIDAGGQPARVDYPADWP